MRVVIWSAIAAASLMAGAGPATAQVVPGVVFTPSRDIAVRNEVSRLYTDINRARTTRAISRPEARSLRRQADQVSRLYRSFTPGGLTRSEAATLHAQIARVRQTLRYY